MFSLLRLLLQWHDYSPTELKLFFRVGSDDHLVDKILDPSNLDGGSQPFRDLQRVLKTSGASTKAWVGEAGGAYNSGRNLVTNTFAFSFW